MAQIFGVTDDAKVKAGAMLFEWDPHRTPILAEVAGMIRFVDIVEGETMRVEEERKGQTGKPVVIEHKGDKHPQIIIEDAEARYSMFTICRQGQELKLSKVSRFRQVSCLPISRGPPAARRILPAVCRESLKCSRPANPKTLRQWRKSAGESN